MLAREMGITDKNSSDRQNLHICVYKFTSEAIIVDLYKFCYEERINKINAYERLLCVTFKRTIIKEFCVSIVSREKMQKAGNKLVWEPLRTVYFKNDNTYRLTRHRHWNYVIKEKQKEMIEIMYKKDRRKERKIVLFGLLMVVPLWVYFGHLVALIYGKRNGNSFFKSLYNIKTVSLVSIGYVYES